MVPMRIFLPVFLVLGSVAMAALAGPTSHALELEEAGSVLFVDLDGGRLLRLHEDQLTLVAELAEIPAGDLRQNLVLSITGQVYLGQKKSVWEVTAAGELEAVKAPAELKVLFVNRPADLAPDGSLYVARDFKNIDRSLPGGDSHPVLITDVISKIHSIAVTPYGRVFYANNSEIAKLDAQGEVNILQKIEDEKIFGMGAIGENEVLVLRQKDGEAVRLERLDTIGKTEVLVSAEQIATVSRDNPVEITSSTP